MRDMSGRIGTRAAFLLVLMEQNKRLTRSAPVGCSEFNRFQAVRAATDRTREPRDVEAVGNVVGVVDLEEVEKTVLGGTDDLFRRWHGRTYGRVFNQRTARAGATDVGFDVH